MSPESYGPGKQSLSKPVQSKQHESEESIPGLETGTGIETNKIKAN